MKKIIGIVPTCTLYLSENKEHEKPYEEYYKFIDMYSSKIIKSGGIPIGLFMDHGEILEESLELCDAFLIPGGNHVYPYIYKIMYYAMKKKKTILGVCMGAEALAIFSCIYETLDFKKDYTYEDLTNIYSQLKEQYEGSLLERLPENNIHAHDFTTNKNLDIYRHPISIKKNSLAYDIYKTETKEVVSFHNFNFKHIGTPFKISANTPDGVGEIIEYKEKDFFFLGVHFHPEIEEDSTLFDYFVSHI